MIVAMLAKVGIKASIEQMEWGAYLKMREALDYQASYSADSWRPDPAGYFDRFFHSKSKGNCTGLNDPEIDRLIDLCLTESDLTKQTQYFRELQHKAAEKVIALFLYSSISRYEMVNKKIKDYFFMPNDSREYLRQTWISQ
jgi:ABC-type transport system substrate-binding protein